MVVFPVASVPWHKTQWDLNTFAPAAAAESVLADDAADKKQTAAKHPTPALRKNLRPFMSSMAPLGFRHLIKDKPN
jgi:hypothetical protein